MSIYKLIIKYTVRQNNKNRNNFEKEEKARESEKEEKAIWFQSCYKAAFIKTMWYWWMDRHIGWQNTTQSLERKPYKHEELIFDVG